MQVEYDGINAPLKLQFLGVLPGYLKTPERIMLHGLMYAGFALV